MVGKNEQFNELNRKSLDAAIRMAKLSFENSQRMVAAAQQIAEIGNAARDEFARLVSEQLASGNQDMTKSMQAFMRNLPAQTPNVMESFQQAIATTNAAFEKLSKASTAAMSSAGKTATSVMKTTGRAKRK